MKNIILIVVDCLGQFFLDGVKRSGYPFLHSLFNQGLSFTQCVSVSTTTSPSVASILTGTYPIRHGIKTLAGARLNPMVPSLAQEMAKRGYNTYAEVTGPLYPELGIGRGFLEYNHRGKSSIWPLNGAASCAGGYTAAGWVDHGFFSCTCGNCTSRDGPGTSTQEAGEFPWIGP